MIASGKGGVGKSVLTAALGTALAEKQLPAALLDADIGLRSLDMLLGLENKVIYDVLDVARKDCKLRLALVQHYAYPELSLLPAAQLGTAGDMNADTVLRLLRKLKKRFAYVLMDAPAGLEKGLKNLIPAADESLLVVTPDDLCMRDAERLIDLLREAGKPRPHLLVNRVVPDMVRSGDMYAPQTVAATLDVPLLGFVPEDDTVRRCVQHHTCLLEESCPSADAVRRIAARLLGATVPMPEIAARKRWFSRRGKGGVTAL